MNSRSSVPTSAPLPEPFGLLRLLRPAVGNAQELASQWLGDGDTGYLFSRAAWALCAVVGACEAGPGGRPIRVWLPDYFCNQALEPLRRRADVVFYPIDQELNPDWQRCEDLARLNPPRVFVIVHYFGKPADVTSARRFSDVHGALMVEDAAHALMPGVGIGRVGDCAIWSLYKHLALPDGGILAVRAGAPIDAMRLEKAIQSLGQATPGVSRTLGWAAKRVLQRLMPAFAARLRSPLPAYPVDPPAIPLEHSASMSPSARRLLDPLRSQLAAIALRRRMNAEALVRAFAGIEDLESVLPMNDGSWVPYRVVLRARNEKRAQYWYDRFRASGNVVESWPDLPPEVRGKPQSHAEAIALRHTLLTLPIHFDHSPDQLVRAYGPVPEVRIA